MGTVLKIILKWFTRIVLGIAALLVLVLFLSFLFRGKITEKAVSIINDSQPGTVELGKLGILPFVHFPDLSLRFTDVSFMAGSVEEANLDTVPVVELEQVFVALNVRSIIKGDYRISDVRFGDGRINFTVGEDSISNLEKALGIDFGGGTSADTADIESKPLLLDLDELQIRNLDIEYRDIPANTMANMRINGLQSSFSIDTDTLLASLMMHVSLADAQLDEIRLDKPREISLSTGLVLDQEMQKISLAESLVDLGDATFELGGEVFLQEQTVDLDFEATNRGIELMNFLLNGILKLDDVEQIGEGYISISGNASGSFDNSLPLLNLDFSAEDMGFRIHAIDQEVTNIAFSGFATNGSMDNLSEATIEIRDFHVDFPDGSLDADLRASNFVSPEIKLDIKGTADLLVLNEIIESEDISGLEGNLRFSGLIEGDIDFENESFLEDAGELVLELDNVGVEIPGHSIEKLYGKIVFSDEIVIMEDLILDLDNNEIGVSGKLDQLMPFLLNFRVDPSFELSLDADRLALESIIGDTLFMGPLRDLNMEFFASIPGDQLRLAMDDKSIPDATMEMKHINVRIPGYTTVSDLSFQLSLEDEYFKLKDFEGMIGESDLALNAEIRNYKSYLEKDTAAPLGIAIELTSEQLSLGELLSWEDTFIGLPELYQEEYIDDFRVEVEVETTVGDLLEKNALPNVSITGDHMHWSFRKYPMEFSDIGMNITLKDSAVNIEEFHGKVGVSNLELKASLDNLFDSTRVIKGSIETTSELLDLNQLLNYELFVGKKENTPVASDEMNATQADSLHMAGSGELAKQDTASAAPPDLSAIDFPDLDLVVDVGELRFEGNLLYNLDGSLSLRPYKILYLDQFSVQSKSGGSIVLDGQFNVSDPELYMLSANINIDTVNISDFDLQLAIEDTIFSLEDNFNGLLSTDGIAEIFMNPDLSVNVDYSTAMFNVKLEDGRVKNFTPLQALGRFTGNTDLDNVKFGLLRNSFTLIGGAVQVPLMAIESNLGLILLEGEQSLTGDFLYLARVPPRLVRGTAWNIVTNQQRKEAEEAEIQRMQAGKFLLLTIATKDGQEEVKIGDKRDRFQNYE